MNDDMFAQILELVSTAGVGGYWLAVLYIGKGYFGTLMGGTIGLSIIFVIARILSQARYISNLANVAGFKFCGPLDGNEKRQLESWVRARKLMD